MEPIFGFSEALHLISSGAAVRRKGWNGKEMHLFLVYGAHHFSPDDPVPNQVLGINQELYERVPHGMITRQPHIAMFTAQKAIVPWVPSQSDMLASDWLEVTDAPNI